MADNAKILAGVTAGGSDGMGLAWFAPDNSTLPTTALEVLDAAFLNAGMITEDGLTFKPSKSVKEIKGYGSTQVQRVLVTEEKTTFELVFLETNEVSMAIYSSAEVDSITPDGTGAFEVDFGTSTPTRYTTVFDVIDGLNHIRFCCPHVEVSDRKEVKVANGESIGWGVTVTAYPDSTGNAVYTYIIVNALAGS